MHFNLQEAREKAQEARALEKAIAEFATDTVDSLD